jgi:hypothetical protein
MEYDKAFISEEVKAITKNRKKRQFSTFKPEGTGGIKSDCSGM